MVGGKHQNINNHTALMVGGKHRGPCREAPTSTQWDREGNTVLNKAAAHKLGLYTFVACSFIGLFVYFLKPEPRQSYQGSDWKLRT